MSFNFGLCSVSFRKNTPEEILQAMRAAGLPVIEWGSDVHCPPENARQIADLQKQYGIRCCSYGTYFRLGVTSNGELTEYIKAARALGTDVLRLWCGDKNSGDYTECEKRELFARCQDAAKIAEAEGVTLCMECHGGTFTDRPESAVELMQAVGSESFKMYWQPSQFRGEEDNLKSAELIAPYTVNLHVFNWKGNEKYPLKEATGLWQRYLEKFRGEHTLLLEFMPDDRLESLTAEADALKGMAK